MARGRPAEDGGHEEVAIPIDAQAAARVGIGVAAPLGDVAVHVEQAERVRAQAGDRRGVARADVGVVLQPTRVAAAEWGPKGVRVNCVAPGLIATDNAMAYYEEVKLDIDAVCSRFPLRRPGRPEEIARAIVFLACEASSYITGETIDITGGPIM